MYFLFIILLGWVAGVPPSYLDSSATTVVQSNQHATLGSYSAELLVRKNYDVTHSWIVQSQCKFCQVDLCG